ncbi:MAG: protoheme IX farnesyltransferase [Nitrospiraceae bacterium]|nr:protoheme IX farnesyltransferase [Nitrospiraceae bacterium]
MKPYLELCRPRISALSALSAAVGFILAAGGMGTGALVAAAGVFFLACGASSLNQYQERESDARMPRTKERPIPSGGISPPGALYFSLSLIVPGLAVLRLSAENAAPFLLGLLALLWYNGVYTFLKKRTVFAAVPGALVGALPPAIGWTSGGGLLADPRVAFLCFFFFMWQTPHFWLLLLDRGPEYEAAGLPSLTRMFRRPQLLRIVFVWTVAAAASVLLIGLVGVVRSPAVKLALCAASAWLVWNSAGLFHRGRPDCSSAFHRINIFALVVMVLMSIDGLVRNIVL